MTGATMHWTILATMLLSGNAGGSNLHQVYEQRVGDFPTREECETRRAAWLGDLERMNENTQHWARRRLDAVTLCSRVPGGDAPDAGAATPGAEPVPAVPPLPDAPK